MPSKGYLKEKNEEAYANVFTMHYPEEERAAARPLKRTPCYDRMKDLGAVFGSVYGWERPGWFAPKGYALSEKDLDRPNVLLNHNHAAPTEDGRIVEKWSFRRSNAFRFVGEECRNVMENVALQDMSAFAKMEVSGPGARDWLDSILANRIPKKMGRIALCHLLTKLGGVRAEFTVYEWAPGRFYLVSAGAFERHDHDTLYKLLPEGWFGEAEPNHNTSWRSGVGWSQGAKSFAEADDNRSLQRSLPMAFRPGNFRGPHKLPCAAGKFCRRIGF